MFGEMLNQKHYQLTKKCYSGTFIIAIIVNESRIHGEYSVK